MAFPSASAKWCRPCSAPPAAAAIYEPLVVTPAIGVSVDPEARILPLDGSALPVAGDSAHPVRGRGHGDAASCPKAGVRSRREAHFKRTAAGDTEPILFSVTPSPLSSPAHTR